MQTRSITEGAMLAAITVLITIIGEYLGLPAFIIPVPLTLLVFRHGLKLGILMSFVSALLAGLIGGHVLSGVTIVIWGFLGIALGMALREEFSFAKTMVVGIVADLVIVALNVLFYSMLFGSNLFEDLFTMVITSLEQMAVLYESMGASSEMLAQLEQMASLYPLLIQWGLPALLLISSVFVAYINLALVRLILKRMGVTIPWISPFSEWQLPAYWGLGLVLAMVFSVFGGSFPEIFQIVGLNLLLIFLPTYLIIGIAVVWHFFKTRRVHILLRVIFVFLAFTISVLLLGLVFVGVLDASFNFRKLERS